MARPNADASPYYHASTSVSLPVSAEELSFVESNFTQGTFNVSQTSDVGSMAVVDINVFYRQPRMLQDINICRLRPSETKWRLGIFVSHDLSGWLSYSLTHGGGIACSEVEG